VILWAKIYMLLTKKMIDVIRAIAEHLALAGELLVIGRIIEINDNGIKNGERQN